MKTLFKRSAMILVIFMTLFGSATGVAPAYAATLTVTNTNDSGAGSLRDTLSGATSGDTINFDASLAGATIHLGSVLTLSQDVTLDGSALTVPVTLSGDSDNDGNGDVQILIVDNAVTVTLNSLVLTKGNAADDVGGAIVNNGILTINGSTLTGNYAANGGGAIYNYTGNTLTISNSTFSNNATPLGGGAITSAGTLTVSNSTFAYNYVSGGGGGGSIASAGTTTVSNSTFTHNTALNGDGAGIFVIIGTVAVTGSTFDHNSAASGASMAGGLNTTMNVSNSTFVHNTATSIAGGIYNNGTLNLTNNTFSGNVAGVGDGVFNSNMMNFANNIIANSFMSDCYNSGTVGTQPNNLIEVGNCLTFMDSDPQLDLLADNGGPLTSSGQATQTMALLPGSPAIDAGDVPSCAAAPVSNLDQRGVTRPFGSECDLGALEYITTYLVTKAADTNDGNCDADCSLREAITAANTDPDGDTIIFNGDYTILLNSNLPSPTDDLTMDGRGHTIIIDGNNNNVLDATASLHLRNLTIQHASSTNGGAIVTHNPSTIINVTFANNTASSNGGAVYNYLTTLHISNSTFAGNSATGGGGAIKNDAGTLIISNSTFSANSAGTGGAIIALGGSTTLRNSTFSDNLASVAAAGIYNNGTLNYANTILANSITNSIAGGDCVNDGTLGINLNNLAEDASCSATLSGDPKLGVLASNGGANQSFALLAHSKAINAGNDAVCAVSPINNLDQRGTPRPNGPHCDMGAYEYVDTTAPTVNGFTAPTTSTSLTIAIPTFSTSDDVAVTGYKITESATPPSVSATGWMVSAPTTYTVTSNGSHSLYPWAKDATGHVSAVYGPVNVTVDTTAPTVSSISLVTTSPTAKASVQFLVTFSEAVSGIMTADFSLTATVTGASIFSVSGSGNTRIVTVHTGSGNGTIRLNIPNTATITDTAGNAISGLPYTVGPVYTINKTLTYTSASAQDGWILESSETSNIGGTLNSAATTFNLGDDATKKQYRGVLSFNTSSIPDNATITGVLLKVKQNAIVGGGSPVTIFGGFMIDIKTGCFATLPGLQIADFQAVASKTLGPANTALVSGYYNFNLVNGKTAINKLASNSGLTQIRLRFNLDDNNNVVANYISLFSGNAPVGSQPQLVITYNVP